MSDNLDVIDYIMRTCDALPWLTAVKMDGPVLHLDRSPWNAHDDDDKLFQTYKRLFLEFLALHYMDIIIAVPSGLSQLPYIRMRIPAMIMNETSGIQTFRKVTV